MTPSPGSPAQQIFQRLWSYGIGFGILNVVLGVVILIWPGPSILVASALFGVYLAISGITQFVLAVSLPAASAGGRVLMLLSSGTSIILAVLAFRHFGEGSAVLLLAIWIAVGFVMRGVSAAATAISDPTYPGRGWAIFFGVVSGIAGVVMLAYPVDSIVTLTLVAGSWLIVIGVAEIVSALGLRHDVGKLGKTIQPSAG